MHKDLFFKTLDKYFEAKGMDGAQRKELIQENLEMYKFPQKWVGWFNEYLGQAPLGPCLPCG
jgi:NADH:ubiquinone oxidoreductase subunit